MVILVNLGNDWDEILQDEFKKEYYVNLRRFLKSEYTNYTVYPNMHDIFNSLKTTAYSDVKAVILGQDPYHNPGQAHGMAFSVQPGVPAPPSLINIYKEMNDDLGIPPANGGHLVPWAKQGVLLLNTVLTVRAGAANSHRAKGWEVFTDCVISHLNRRNVPIVFLLWGSPAKAKQALITNPAHLVLTASHPSPLSAYNGFFGCKHFSKTNDFLTSTGQTPIDWKLV